MDATSELLVGLEPGGLIRRSRLLAGLTQAELARRLGTTQSAVSRLERGREEPRLARLASILAACGVRASLTLQPDDGVDRAQIRQQLALTPVERLASVTNVSRFVAEARRV
jgi:transcriptional regulator with XRE-family HTH domain